MSTSLYNLAPLESAITVAEGVNPSYNNPGALALGDQGYGTFGQGITIFGSASQGEAALSNMLTNILNGNNPNYSPNMTISQLGDVYVNGPNGGTSSASQSWAQNVASFLGVPTSTPIASLASPSYSSAIPSLGSPLDSSDWQQMGEEAIQNELSDFELSGLGPSGLASGVSQGLNSMSQETSSPASGWLARITAIAVGIVSIGIGLMMFRPTQEILVSAGKGVAEGLA